jgi:hypothetical protein
VSGGKAEVHHWLMALQAEVRSNRPSRFAMVQAAFEKSTGNH